MRGGIVTEIDTLEQSSRMTAQHRRRQSRKLFALGINKAEIARRLGVSAARVNHYINGHGAKDPVDPSICKVCGGPRLRKKAGTDHRGKPRFDWRCQPCRRKEEQQRNRNRLPGGLTRTAETNVSLIAINFAWDSPRKLMNWYNDNNARATIALLEQGIWYAPPYERPET